MHLDGDVVPAALLERLTADDEPGRAWEPAPAADALRCEPDLVARLAEVARPLGPVQRRFVAGCPVIEHPNGRPIAAAAGTAWVAVRSALAPGALAPSNPRPVALGAGWVELDPWGTDIAFARVVDLMRAHVARAYELAGGGA